MAKTSPDSRRRSHPEAQGLSFLALAFFLGICLCTFHVGDRSGNWLGLVGYGIAWGMTYLFGIMSYAVVLYLGWVGWRRCSSQEVERRTHFYYALFLICCCLLWNLAAERASSIPFWLSDRTIGESLSLSSPYPHRAVRHNLGGVPCYYLYRDLPTLSLRTLFGDAGIGIVCSLAGVVFLLFATEVRLVPLVGRLKRVAAALLERRNAPVPAPSAPTRPEAQAPKRSLPPPLYAEPKIHRPIQEKREQTEPAPACDRLRQGYQLPPPSLLTNPKKTDAPSLKKELRRQADILEETLMSFGIEAKVGEIYSGPTITSFEVHPAVGVKVQKITVLENDIALNLQAPSIRIIAPIPGKAAVGVEVPSLYPQEVSFKEMLLHYQHNQKKMQIPVILGKTVAGDHVMSDLAKMPHCIIAGATGSGKSVCINTLIMSILMNARPDEIKLLMIDPKKVELTPYASLPHMIAPVITEAHGAYAALSWLVKEMQLRYDILKQLGVRNIAAFNSRQVNRELEASLSIPIPERMYAIVAIIDEFADLMMVSSSDLETPIARIAQMARAVGIHLVLATQRPSREVITGLIKANFPTRIAFKVASRINSQIILDETGAETLLGNGDMLFLPPGSSHLIRAQGAYISDEDINKVVSFICAQAPSHYLIASFDALSREDSCASGEEEGARDMLYEEALRLVLDTRSASTTFLQRKLKIGYARAASLIDELEAKGVIGPQEGSRPRRVLRRGSALDKESYLDESEQPIPES
jgi:S-DNA-T family DNA segregation ATPase FtsK/SpoIIIE